MKKLFSKNELVQMSVVRIKISLIMALCFMILPVSRPLLADSVSGTIGSVQIGAAEITHRGYMHYKIIGLCLWEKEKRGIPHFYTTLEVSEYKPDLVVTVYNEYGDDPWTLPNNTTDSTSEALGESLYQSIIGETLGEGNSATSMGHMSYANLRSKLVDVMGSPLNTLVFAFPQLDADTVPLLPYYQSDMDSLGRQGIAEAMRPETYEPFGQPIGDNALNSWSFEFPRDMKVNVDDDFKASIITALRAADIVTNKNLFHTVISTSDSCGQNCAVASVKESGVAKVNPDTGEFKPEQFDNEPPPETIWQEVYPYDKPIQPGENDALLLEPLGKKESLKSSNNLVFVIWRHYEGCVQHSGTLRRYSKKIKTTEKR